MVIVSHNSVATIVQATLEAPLWLRRLRCILTKPSEKIVPPPGNLAYARCLTSYISLSSAANVYSYNHVPPNGPSPYQNGLPGNHPRIGVTILRGHSSN